MITTTVSRDEFAARRRTRQDDAIAALTPIIEAALDDFDPTDPTNDDWYQPVAAAIRALFLDVYREEGATEAPNRIASFMISVVASLRRIKDPDAYTADRVATSMAIAAINAATIDAAENDPEPLLLEWVTMHDTHVRAAHVDTDGQQRPPGERFDVAGEPMRYPGDPAAPIELWINCRCMLRPLLLDDTFSTITNGTFAISEKPWNGSASRFTDEQWKRSCIVHLADTLNKSDHKLPIKEPGGALSRAGVHAAAGRLNQTDAPAEKIASAKARLRGAYKTLGEDPPEKISAALNDEPDVEVDEDAIKAAVELLPWHGVLAPEGVKSGDGRTFAPDSLTWRDLPLPLTWQKQSDEGHLSSVTVGDISHIERRDGLLHASGVFLPTPEADEVVGMIAHFGKYGVSVDADSAEFDFDEESGNTTFSAGRIASACIVSIPAFMEAFVTLGHAEELAASAFGRGPGWITHPKETKRIHDYWTRPGQPGYIKIGWGAPGGGDFNRCRIEVGEEIGEESPEKLRFINQICAQWHHDALGFWPGHAPTEQALDPPEGTMAPAVTMVASGGHLAPAGWFVNPNLTAATHVTITDEGRVFGHIAEWTACHIGYEGVCVSPPHSTSGYGFFASGQVLLDDGQIARVGQITTGGGHAPKGLRARAAIQHYDSTSTAVADVAVGEDEHGIWCAGWVRPGVSDDLVTALRASDVSGDWRMIGDSMEMVAALGVNVGGFPTGVAVRNGRQVALVAAGMVEQDTADDTIEKFGEAVAAALENRAKRREAMQVFAAKFEETGE